MHARTHSLKQGLMLILLATRHNTQVAMHTDINVIHKHDHNNIVSELSTICKHHNQFNTQFNTYTQSVQHRPPIKYIFQYRPLQMTTSSVMCTHLATTFNNQNPRTTPACAPHSFLYMYMYLGLTKVISIIVGHPILGIQIVLGTTYIKY